MSALILYTTEDGCSQIKLRVEDKAVRLTQLEIAVLFDATEQKISLNLKDLFDEADLDADSVLNKSLTAQRVLTPLARSSM